MAAELQQLRTTCGSSATWWRRADRREPGGGAPRVRYWAIYVLVGYFLIDVAPQAAGWFFMVGAIIALG